SEITSDHLESDGTFTCRWRVQPDDHSANYLEIWFPKSPEAAADLEPEKPDIRDPSGNQIELGEPVQSTNSPAQKIW
ncbi:hypothetical protein, partial [Klebsiella pneumoniae]|uniref:hypothetical protein n=1 Tax=Klebsiella pneumoniae TaxID=573 RepID=UPI0013D1A391